MGFPDKLVGWLNRIPEFQALITINTIRQKCISCLSFLLSNPGSNREVQSSSAQPSYLGINVSIVITGLFGFMAFTVQATAPLT